MASRADILREDARYAGEEAKRAHSDDDGAMHRKRQSAMMHLAENDDWLQGRAPLKNTNLVASR